MKITKTKLKQIIREELDQSKGAPIPGALDSADAWYDKFMGMIKTEFDSSGWSMASIGPELLGAVERLQRQVKKEVDRADQKAAGEILNTRMGSYKGTTLPGGKKI